MISHIQVEMPLFRVHLDFRKILDFNGEELVEHHAGVNNSYRKVVVMLSMNTMGCSPPFLIRFPGSASDGIAASVESHNSNFTDRSHLRENHDNLSRYMAEDVQPLFPRVRPLQKHS
jgi:hypothetical protein